MSERDTAPPARAVPPRRPPAGPSGSLPLFRIFGIQIRLDWSWLIIFLLLSYVLWRHFSGTLKGEPGWVVAALAAASVISLFACVLAHELAHSLVAMRHGIQMFDITLFVFGGMARLRGEPKNPNAELKIALAGPAVTFLLAAAFWTAWYFLRGHLAPVVVEGLHYLATINSALLVFNLIPGFPLDGGRVLRALLWKTRGNLLSATRTAATVGKGFGMVLILGGVLLLFHGAAVGGIFHIFLGWFLAGAARRSVQHMQIRRLLEVFRVTDAMQRNVVAVPPLMTLDRLISEGFYRYHFTTYPVLSAGRFSGLISLADVQRIPPAQWPVTTVAQAAEPAGPALTIHPDTGLYEAFRRMAEDNIGRLIVTDYAGHILGLVSRRDIMNLLRIYSELDPTLGDRPPRPAIPVAKPVEPGEFGPALPADGNRAEPDRQVPAGSPSGPTT